MRLTGQIRELLEFLCCTPEPYAPELYTPRDVRRIAQLREWRLVKHTRIGWVATNLGESVADAMQYCDRERKALLELANRRGWVPERELHGIGESTLESLEVCALVDRADDRDDSPGPVVRITASGRRMARTLDLVERLEAGQ